MRGAVLYLAINGSTEEELVISRVEVQCSHKVCMPAHNTLLFIQSSTHSSGYTFIICIFLEGQVSIVLHASLQYFLVFVLAAAIPTIICTEQNTPEHKKNDM